MKDILIIGSSGHARVVLDIIEKEGAYSVRGFIDDFREIGYHPQGGPPILGKITDLPRLEKVLKLHGALIAIGDNWRRGLIAQRIKELCPALKFISTIDPSANIAKSVLIGGGSVIMPGVSVNSQAKIGGHCILNTHSSLDHDSVMQNFSSLAPSATVGGNSKIGTYSAIGLKAAVIHKIVIGEKTVVGAGSVVVSSLKSNLIAYGIPSKAIRKRKDDEKYL